LFSDFISQKLYFNEEFELDNSELCETMLQCHGISESTAKLLLLEQGVTRLVFKGTKLVSKDIGDWGGEWNIKTQMQVEENFQYRETPIHPVSIIEYAEKGLHHIGGTPPPGFLMPNHPELPVSCQYIGQISNIDPAFSWLPMPVLNLAYPLFASFGPMFMSYEQPDAPVILDIDFYDHPFKCVTRDSVIVYEKLHWNVASLRTDPNFGPEMLVGGFGWTGVPFWIQHPEWPRCPISGNLMKFVVSMDSTKAKAIEKHHLSQEDANIVHYLDTLNFWLEGALYVFMEPETKVVCMLIQNT